MPERVDFVCEFGKMVNRLLLKQGGGHALLSFIGVTFEPGSNLVHFVGAGHPAPLGIFKQSDGAPQSEFMRTSTVPLGQKEDLILALQTKTFSQGDELIIYSDGFRERKSFAALQRFMETRGTLAQTDPRVVFGNSFKGKATQPTGKEQDDLSVIWFKAA